MMTSKIYFLLFFTSVVYFGYSSQPLLSYNFSDSSNIYCKKCDEDGCYRGGEENKDFPEIITPRFTLLLNPQPTLRWYKVEGITSYTVQIQGSGAAGENIEWQKLVSTNNVVYDGPSLQPGETYLFSVNAHNGQPIAKTTFKMLSEEKAKTVQAEIKQIEQKQLEEEAKILALVDIHLSYELIAEAIDTLEQLVANNSKNPVVYRQLADLYKQIRLVDLANAREQKAKELEGLKNLSLMNLQS